MLPPAVPSISPGEKCARSRRTCRRRRDLAEGAEEGADGLAEGAAGVEGADGEAEGGACGAGAGAMGETLPDGFGVGSVPPAGAAGVVAGGSDLDEHAAADVARSSANAMAVRRSFVLS